MTREDLAELIEPSLGREKALALVNEKARESGVQGLDLSVPQALRVLEIIGTSPGLVGIAARFARARVHLMPR